MQEWIDRLINSGLRAKVDHDWHFLGLISPKEPRDPTAKDSLRKILSFGIDWSSSQFSQSDLANLAILAKDAELVQMLLESDLDPNIAGKWCEAPQAPLLTATFRGQKSIAELLIAFGADINTRNDDGSSPLMVVMGALDLEPKRKQEMVDCLLKKGADIQVRDKDGLTALSKALIAGEWKISCELLAKGALFDEGVAERTMCAAASAGRTVTVEMLLGFGVDVDARDPPRSDSSDVGVLCRSRKGCGASA